MNKKHNEEKHIYFFSFCCDKERPIFLALLSKNAINFQTWKIDMGEYVLTITEKEKENHGNFHHTTQNNLQMANL